MGVVMPSRAARRHTRPRRRRGAPPLRIALSALLRMPAIAAVDADMVKQGFALSGTPRLYRRSDGFSVRMVWGRDDALGRHRMIHLFEVTVGRA